MSLLSRLRPVDTAEGGHRDSCRSPPYHIADAAGDRLGTSSAAASDVPTIKRNSRLNQ